MANTFWREVRFALRGLFRDRGFALTALLSIGLGVGANAAIFSLVNQALFRLLPVSEPDRLVLLDWRGSVRRPGLGQRQPDVVSLLSGSARPDRRVRRRVRSCANHRQPRVREHRPNRSAPRSSPAPTSRCSASARSLGRLLDESDDQQPGAHPVVVLSFDYWRNHLGSRPDIVGRTVLVNTHPMTVIGVAAEGFRGVDWGEVPSVWVPTMMKRRPRRISTGCSIGADAGCTCSAG